MRVVYFLLMAPLAALVLGPAIHCSATIIATEQPDAVGGQIKQLGLAIINYGDFGPLPGDDFPLVDASLDFGGTNIFESGPEAVRSYADVPPLETTGVDDTAYFNLTVDERNYVTVSFLEPTPGFGASFRNGGGLVGWRVNLTEGPSQLFNGHPGNGFFGLYTTEGELIESIDFLYSGPTGGEANFFVDDLVYAGVPEPSYVLCVFAVALFAVGRRHARKPRA